MLEPGFNHNIEESIKKHWDLDAISDYGIITWKYRDIAQQIAKLHILFREAGIKKGDKIALCGRNQSNWGISFLATLTYGAVAVPILHEFSAEQVQQIVNHSESKLLFVGDAVWKKLKASEMTDLEGIILLTDFSVLESRNKAVANAVDNINRLFGDMYPKSFGREDIHYHIDEKEELAVINYTSGTTSNSKGVMIPYRALWGNMQCAEEIFLEKAHAKVGDNILSMLPMAHTYGMAFEFLYEFIIGVHVHFLTRTPSPAILLKALADIRPIVLVVVPLILEKIVKKAVLPKVQDPKIALLLKTPYVGKKLKKRICDGIRDAFGGNFYEVIVGGAAMNQEIETLLHDIGFPYAIGYGATECAPLLAFEDWKDFCPGSCGKAVNRMELKIDSPDPQNTPGEILARGMNVMLGYYKNTEATADTLKDGWYHTGDLGIIDKEGNVFIKGRSKNMLLGANGQNIYPEEIEDKLNSMPMVIESVVVQREEKLYGLVYPDYDTAKKNGKNKEELIQLMEQNRKDMNATLPAFQQLSGIEIMETEFEKTPKKSIKRFLYT